MAGLLTRKSRAHLRPKSQSGWEKFPLNLYGESHEANNVGWGGKGEAEAQMNRQLCRPIWRRTPEDAQ